MPLVFNNTTWEPVWDVNINAIDERLVCPLILNAPIIALMLTAPVYQTNWKFGAYIQREVFSGLTVGGTSDARLDSARKLYVNRLQIYTYNFSCAYILTANCFVGGTNTRISVWEYTGIITP